MISRDDVHKAIDDGILDAIKDRAKFIGVNELSEPAQTAQDQFATGLIELKDAHDRAHAVVDKVFPE